MEIYSMINMFSLLKSGPFPDKSLPILWWAKTATFPEQWGLVQWLTAGVSALQMFIQIKTMSWRNVFVMIHYRMELKASAQQIVLIKNRVASIHLLPQVYVIDDVVQGY